MSFHRKESRKSISNMLKTLLKPLEKNVRTAIFLSLYPTLFRLFNLIRQRSHPEVEDMKDSLDVSVPSTSILSESPIKNRKRISSVLRELALPTNPAFLLAPLCVLLPPNWLAQLNLYSTTAAGLALVRYISGKIDQGELRWRPSWAQSQSGTVRKIRRHRPYWMGEKDPGSVSTDELSQLALESQDGQGERCQGAGEVDLLVLLRNALRAGGSWWLFPLSQGWLLYTAVFEGDCFPTSYKNVIVSVSTNMTFP